MKGEQRGDLRFIVIHSLIIFFYIIFFYLTERSEGRNDGFQRETIS